MRSGLHHGSLERIGTEYKMKLDIYRIDDVFRLIHNELICNVIYRCPNASPYMIYYLYFATFSTVNANR